MKKIWIGPAAIVAAASLAWIGAASAQAPARNVWDGVFTADQAAQGKSVFDNKGATCHGAELTGAEMAPPLSGGQFLGNWSGQALGDLFVRIHTTMPANDPGKLTRQQAADIVAYMLQVAKFPAGQTELGADEAVLKDIAIPAPPGGK
jgi:mono/diheme cytochrome c family protein